MTNPKFVLVWGVVGVAAFVSWLLQHQAQPAFYENEAALRQQDEQVIKLAVENQRLSNLVFQTGTNTIRVIALTNELAYLRAKVEALRQQTNRLLQDFVANRHRMGVRLFTLGDSNLLDYNKEIGYIGRGGPKGTEKQNDAVTLNAAIHAYARQHHWEFPVNLDDVASYLPKPSNIEPALGEDAPLTGTNDFEIVYRGSQNDLTNIPLRRVVLIRERQPWQTSDGKWARVYGYADGVAETVVSDDNFQSWDAQHIIPSPAGGQ